MFGLHLRSWRGTRSKQGLAQQHDEIARMEFIRGIRMRKRAELYGQERRRNLAVSFCCTTSAIRYYVRFETRRWFVDWVMPPPHRQTILRQRTRRARNYDNI